MANHYFSGYLQDQRLLHDHGFNDWPTNDELTRYTMDLEDLVNLLGNAMGLDPCKDVRGRWQLIPAPKDGDRTW